MIHIYIKKCLFYFYNLSFFYQSKLKLVSKIKIVKHCLVLVYCTLLYMTMYNTNILYWEMMWYLCLGQQSSFTLKLYFQKL